MKTILYITIALILLGCVSAPIPKVKMSEQTITSVQTNELNKIKSFGNYLSSRDKRVVYLYIESDGAVNESGTGSEELPPRMRRQLTSILMDFGDKVKVVDNVNTFITLHNVVDKQALYFSINGAITRYDKNIMSQSSGFDFGIDFGGGSTEANSNTDFKDKDTLTILGVDFYLKNLDGIVLYKTASQIDIRSTTRGYSFGISINKAGIGMSAYKNIQDGVGLSVRKMLQESMYNLLRQVYSKEK